MPPTSSAVEPFIANTDPRWFHFLYERWGRRVDEANFWSPKAQRPMKRMEAGTPIFLRLKHPFSCLAGYGFLGHFKLLELDLAWELFGPRNGDPDKAAFLERIGSYRGENLFRRDRPRLPLASTILRDVHLWPEARWIPWGPAEGWKIRTQQGATERDPARVRWLMALIARDAAAPPREFASRFELMDVDERQVVLARTQPREGQGTFLARLLDAYGGRCAITGERTAPVLDAAHIQPYLGPGSNHLQNGLLLTQEFHTLFELGFVTVTPEHEVRVSPRLRREWHDGRRYYQYDGLGLRALPEEAHLRPDPEALAWHGEHVFQDAA